MNLDEIRNRIFTAIENEEKRQHEGVNLIASENLSSDDVRRAAGSMLAHKYAEGYPGKRWYGGCQYVDECEEIAVDLAKKVFGAQYANVQPHAGAIANLIVYTALLSPGDTIMSLLLNQGGHLSHGSPANISGKLYNFVHYPVKESDCTIDYDEMERLALEHKPKILLGGASSYPREFDWKRMRQIADKIGAILMADVAHTAGLIAAGVHKPVFPDVHVMTTTTHKTLRGPRGALICAQEEFEKKFQSGNFPGIQGGPFMHMIAAKALALRETLTDEFREYQREVLASSAAMAKWFIDRGKRVVTGGTDCHFFLLDVYASYGVNGDQAEKRLMEDNIAVNKNGVAYDPMPISKTSGLRIGTPFMCSRGWKTADFLSLAEQIDKTLTTLGESDPSPSPESFKKRK
ncbi:MAG: serine hydroxymethyltransferase [Planctomycetes bacterium]|nr:serine hydroxymethyltransferase [Planctomycetota bacterium]